MVFWINLLVALLFVALGAAVKYGKCYWLIAGYNTMPRHKKENVDAKGLGNFLGNAMFVLSALLLLAGIFSYLNVPCLPLLSWAVFYAVIIYMLAGAQRYDHNPKTKSDRLVLAFAFGGLVVIGLVVSLLIFTSSLPAKVSVEEGYIKIGGSYSLELPLTEVKEIVLTDEMPRVLHKVNGFDAGAVKKGLFQVEGLGAGRLFIHSARGPYLFIYTADSFLILNFKDAQQTNKLYKELRSFVLRQNSKLGNIFMAY